jgi:hypothetical protein
MSWKPCFASKIANSPSFQRTPGLEVLREKAARVRTTFETSGCASRFWEGLFGQKRGRERKRGRGSRPQHRITAKLHTLASGVPFNANLEVLMGRLTPEQKYANRLLRRRGSDLTMQWLWRTQWKLIVFAFIYSLIATAFLLWIDASQMAFLFVGFAVSQLCSLVSVFLAQRRIWRMQRRITDWNKVERMAAGEPLEH